jgi:hypothetical protein
MITAFIIEYAGNYWIGERDGGYEKICSVDIEWPPSNGRNFLLLRDERHYWNEHTDSYKYLYAKSHLTKKDYEKACLMLEAALLLK